MSGEVSKLRGKGLEIGTDEASRLKGKGLDIVRHESGEASGLVGSLAARAVVGLEISEEDLIPEAAKVESFVSVKNGGTYVLSGLPAREGLVRLKSVSDGSIITLSDTVLSDPERFRPLG